MREKRNVPQIHQRALKMQGNSDFNWTFEL